MGKIKSAWEIALEKTEDIVVDTDKIRRGQTTDKIRRTAGSYLIGENNDVSKLEKELSEFTIDELKEGLSLTVLNGLTLPVDEVTDDRYDRLNTLFDIVTGNDAQAKALFEQITGLLKQYPVHRKQLLEQMKEQFEPMLRDKEEQMREQYGQEVHLTLENDKEFAQVVRQNLDKLEKQYQQTLDNAKTQLKAFFS